MWFVSLVQAWLQKLRDWSELAPKATRPPSYFQWHEPSFQLESHFRKLGAHQCTLSEAIICRSRGPTAPSKLLASKGQTLPATTLIKRKREFNSSHVFPTDRADEERCYLIMRDEFRNMMSLWSLLQVGRVVPAREWKCMGWKCTSMMSSIEPFIEILNSSGYGCAPSFVG